MKLINVLFGISCLCLLYNCKKDKMEPSIIGTWYPQTAVQNLYENGNKYNTATYMPSEKTFSADGTGLMSNGDLFSKPFSWTLEGDVLTITLLSEHGVLTTSTWSVLYINANSFQIKNTIKQTTTSNQEYLTESIETYVK